MRLSASLVLYNNPLEKFLAATNSFLQGCRDGVLYISDNSPGRLQHPITRNARVRYMFNGRNLGFGAGHNKIILHQELESDFHLLLNPDVRFEPHVLPYLVNLLAQHPSIGLLMPQIQYPNGSLQRLCKLLPTPGDLISRRFIPFKSIRNRKNKRYELHDMPHTGPIEVPSLSGCFLLMRTDLVRRIGGFDERYFLYMEDVDLVRRMGDHAKTVYVPDVKITHDYAKGSYQDTRLLWHHIRSALKYFQKWGWVRDPVRENRNQEILARLSGNRLPSGEIGVPRKAIHAKYGNLPANR